MEVICWKYKGGCGLGIKIYYPDILKKTMSMKVVKKNVSKKNSEIVE